MCLYVARYISHNFRKHLASVRHQGFSICHKSEQYRARSVDGCTLSCHQKTSLHEQQKRDLDTHCNTQYMRLFELILGQDKCAYERTSISMAQLSAAVPLCQALSTSCPTASNASRRKTVKSLDFRLSGAESHLVQHEAYGVIGIAPFVSMSDVFVKE